MPGKKKKSKKSKKEKNPDDEEEKEVNEAFIVNLKKYGWIRLELRLCDPPA
jgi:hypothetical protein